MITVGQMAEHFGNEQMALDRPHRFEDLRVPDSPGLNLLCDHLFPEGGIIVLNGFVSPAIQDQREYQEGGGAQTHACFCRYARRKTNRPGPDDFSSSAGAWMIHTPILEIRV